MTPLSFWVTDVNDQDVASIIRQELKLAQNQKQYAIKPANGKLCLGHWACICLDFSQVIIVNDSIRHLYTK